MSDMDAARLRLDLPLQLLLPLVVHRLHMPLFALKFGICYASVRILNRLQGLSGCYGKT